MTPTLRFKEIDEDNPSWERVEHSIRSLGGEKDTVSLGDFKKEDYLGISCNDEGLYVVFVTYRNLECHILVRTDGNDIEHKFIIGGQAVSYPARFCHKLEDVIRVARVYYETGDRDFKGSWENG